MKGTKAPRTSLLGSVTGAGGRALRRVGRLSRLGAPVGSGFRFLRDAALTGVMIARGVSDALRQPRGGTDEEPLDEERPETDLGGKGVEDELGRSFDTERFDVTETEDGRLYQRKPEPAPARKPAPKRKRGARRSTRRRATKNAGVRRR